MSRSAHRLFVLAACLALTACAAAGPARSGAAPAADSGRYAVKGYELYSWEDPTGEWRYALLVGSNRLKTWDEIQPAAMLEWELRQALADLERGENVTWCTTPPAGLARRLAYPPRPKMDAFFALARRRQINLRLCE